MRTARSHRRRRSRRTRSSRAPICTTKRPATTRGSGRARRLIWSTGTRSGTRFSIGNCRMRSGSRAECSTWRTTVSIGTCWPAVGDKVAFHWEGEPGDTRTITYQDLLDEVCRFSNVLKGLGVQKGDRVNIYLPMIPEAAVAMLACARIGAAHSVVFGGFSSQSLSDRINDADAKVLITADGGYRRGEVFPLKPTADEACETTPSIEHVVVVKRGGNDVTMVEGRDHWYHDLMDGASDRVSGRADGGRAPALPALHLGHHRQAQGHHAHDRRLPHPRHVHPQVRVRPAARDRRLLVHRRRRLDHRAQLHRLRAAVQRLHPGDVRGRPQPPRATTGSGRSSRSTASRSSTPRRPPSARS